MQDIFSDTQQIVLKYLKNIEVNLNNVLIMIGDFNIRDNNWDFLYPHYPVHTNTLREIIDLFNLELSIPINKIPTAYADNMTESNLIINLMLL